MKQGEFRGQIRVSRFLKRAHLVCEFEDRDQIGHLGSPSPQVQRGIVLFLFLIYLPSPFEAPFCDYFLVCRGEMSLVCGVLPGQKSLVIRANNDCFHARESGDIKSGADVFLPSAQTSFF